MGVIDDLLRDQVVVTQVLNIDRGWSGLAIPAEKKGLHQGGCAPDNDEANQAALWGIFQTFLHELLHVPPGGRGVRRLRALST